MISCEPILNCPRPSISLPNPFGPSTLTSPSQLKKISLSEGFHTLDILYFHSFPWKNKVSDSQFVMADRLSFCGHIFAELGWQLRLDFYVIAFARNTFHPLSITLPLLPIPSLSAPYTWSGNWNSRLGFCSFLCFRTKWKRQTAVGLELLAEAGNYAAFQRLYGGAPYGCWPYTGAGAAGPSAADIYYRQAAAAAVSTLQKPLPYRLYPTGLGLLPGPSTAPHLQVRILE